MDIDRIRLYLKNLIVKVQLELSCCVFFGSSFDMCNLVKCKLLKLFFKIALELSDGNKYIIKQNQVICRIGRM